MIRDQQNGFALVRRKTGGENSGAMGSSGLQEAEEEKTGDGIPKGAGVGKNRK